jgi:hypothetical protein
MRTKRLVLMLAIVLLGVCIIQAFYFPFMLSPESIKWWLFGLLASIGLLAGFPVQWTWEAFFSQLPFRGCLQNIVQ